MSNIASKNSIGNTFTQIKKQETKETKNNTLVPEVNGITIPNVICYHCRLLGHIQTFCPILQNTKKIQYLQNTHALSQIEYKISRNWLLLDTCSSISSMCNTNLVKNISPNTQPYHAYTNGGSIDDELECELQTLSMNAYCNAKDIANIISLGELVDDYRMKMDINKNHSIYIQYKNKQDKTGEFKKLKNNLFFLTYQKEKLACPICVHTHSFNHAS